MERLRAHLEDDNVSVLVHQRDLMMVLLKDRHVRYEKTNIGFLNGFRFKTKELVLTKSQIAEMVRTKYHPFYASDIEEVDSFEDHFLVTLRDDVTIHYGQFTIFKEL